MAEDRSERLTFLYKAIDDNQATIRFLDTKAGFGIAILGAMISKVLDRDQLVACESHGFVVLAVSITFALLVIAAAVLGYKAVFPTVNPAQNASVPDSLEPKFFISKLSPRRFLRLLSGSKKFAMLESTHASYCATLGQATAEQIEAVVAAEVLKLSFIRQLKMDRLAAFANLLIPTVALFVVVTFAAPKTTAEKPSYVPTQCPPAITSQGPRDIYNCAPKHAPSK